MIPEVNIIIGKASVVSFSGAWGFGRYSETLNRDFRSPLRKVLGTKERLDWLKIDMNAAEIITVQLLFNAVNGSTHMQY